MTYKTLTYEVLNSIGVLTLNMPEQRNVLDLVMRLEIQDVLLNIREKCDIRALVLTGAGGAFCAGGDLKSLQEAPSGAARRERVRRTHIWIEELVNLEVPVIAAVDGVAFGGGFSFVLAADFVFCTPRARFSAVFLRAGLIPDLGCLYLLPRLVGLQKAKDLLFTARIVEPEEMQQLGLVYEIVEQGSVVATARAFAERFLDAPRMALGITKNILNQSLHSDHWAISELESMGQALCADSDYYRAATTRFLQKKPALFAWEKYQN